MRKRWAKPPIRLWTKSEVGAIPTSVRDTKRTTGGAIKGNITENILVKDTASIEKAIANSGLYVLGYVASRQL
jgi:hypothetical protein